VTDKGTEENVESERETARGPSRSARRDSRRNTSQRRQTPRTTRAQVARRRSGYTNEEIERGLHHVAVLSGNVSRAARELAEDGLDVPVETLRDWVRKHHVERYRAIEAKVVPEIHARMAEQNEALALRHAEVEARSLERLEKELPNMAARDVSTTTRNLAVSKGIAIDKARDLRGTNREPELNPIKAWNEGVAALQNLGLLPKDPKQTPNLEEIEADVEEQDEG
jgi:hypothetical protein